MSMEHISDPIERIVAEALTAAGIRFETHYGVHHGAPDFLLPDHGVYIECKQFYTERTAKQMASVPNVIVIQGRKAAEAFASMITNKRTAR